MLITTQNFQINQSSNCFKSIQKNNSNNKETILYRNNPQKILPQHFHSQVSFGMINPLLKKAMRSPIFLQMKTIYHPLWQEFNCLSPKINLLSIQQMFQNTLKDYLEKEKHPDALFNEEGRAIQLAETEERYEFFYHNQHLRWQIFFTQDKKCDILGCRPDEIFLWAILDCRKKIPDEIEKNKETLASLEQEKDPSHEIEKQIEKTKKLLILQENYLKIADDENLAIDKEALKLSTAQGIISGLRHKNFIIFKHNIPVFQKALDKYIGYQLLNPPDLIKHHHPSEKELSHLSKIIGIIPNKPTFSQCMKYAFLQDIYEDDLPLHPIFDNKKEEEVGIFIKIPQTEQNDPNFNKRLALMRYLSHSNWCTKFKSARSYLKGSDFYCFTPYEGGRKICFIIKNNEELHSLESAENSHFLREEDYEIFSAIITEAPELVEIVRNSPQKDLLDKLNIK